MNANAASAPQQKPPVLVILKYRFLRSRVPEEWRAWVDQDISSSTWPVKMMLAQTLPLVATFLLLSLVLDRSRGSVIGAVVGPLVVLLPLHGYEFMVKRSRAREEMRRFQWGEQPPTWVLRGSRNMRRGCAVLIMLAGVALIVGELISIYAAR